MTRALDAVARVRRVREQASLLGLVVLRREVEEAEVRLGHLEAALAVPPAAYADTGSFLGERTRLLALGEAAERAREHLRSTERLSIDARAHWERDRTRLRGIEMLQERRDAERLDEEARGEQQRLDEVSGQLWSRTRTEEAPR